MGKHGPRHRRGTDRTENFPRQTYGWLPRWYFALCHCNKPGAFSAFSTNALWAPKKLLPRFRKPGKSPSGARCH